MLPLLLLVVCTMKSSWQLKAMEKSSDDGNSSLLASAIAGKSAFVFKAVVSLVEQDLSPEEVREHNA